MPEDLKARHEGMQPKAYGTLRPEGARALERMADTLSAMVGYSKVGLPKLIADFEGSFKSSGFDPAEAWRIALLMVHQKGYYNGCHEFHPDYRRLTEAGVEISARLFRLSLRTEQGTNS